MMTTSEEVRDIKAHLSRLGLLCTADEPCGITVQPLEASFPCVQLADDHATATYDVRRLLDLLPSATTEDFWQDVSAAEEFAPE